jgi:hypothetical protein
MILGEEPVLLRRYTTSMARGSDGRIASTLSYDETTILMSVQPLNGQELSMLPEGERHRDRKKGYTITLLRTADQHLKTMADRIVVDGIEYEVHQVERERSVIPHYKVSLIRVQEQDPGFGG